VEEERGLTQEGAHNPIHVSPCLQRVQAQHNSCELLIEFIRFIFNAAHMSFNLASQHPLHHTLCCHLCFGFAYIFPPVSKQHSCKLLESAWFNYEQHTVNGASRCYMLQATCNLIQTHENTRIRIFKPPSALQWHCCSTCNMPDKDVTGPEDIVLCNYHCVLSGNADSSVASQQTRST
jgi:hypothetical protein